MVKSFRLKPRTRGFGSNHLLGMATLILGVMFSAFAIDMGVYYTAQNQLQTAVDAAALAGARDLPNGENYANDAAIEVGSDNMVGDSYLSESDFNFSYTGNEYSVSASKMVPTTISKLFCGGVDAVQEGEELPESGVGSGGNCMEMKVSAHASAKPAARDTILVIDTSSSMSINNSKPIKDVKTSAKNFINIIKNLNNDSIDRIGLVQFNQTGKLEIKLTSQIDSPGYTTVINKVNGLSLFSGSGWNTNYEAGLKIALDEMAAHGRPNAKKNIIFLTDGMPNLPAPTNYYGSGYTSSPYNRCITPVHNSSQVKALCYYSGGQKICPTLPSSKITDSMIRAVNISFTGFSGTAEKCGETYVNYITSATQAQSDRAKAMDVTINTISIGEDSDSDNASNVLRRLIIDPNWDPTDILNAMSDTTDGQAYDANGYNATLIDQIYTDIAEDVNVKLTGN